MARWLTVTLALLGLVAVPVPGTAARAKHGLKAKHGVKAHVKHRTLTITGNRRPNSVTLRRKGRRLIVDVKSNGSADFKFRLRSFRRIAVNGGRGRDRLVLTGSGHADSFALSRKGRRLRVARATGARPLSGRGIETVQVNPGGGADAVSIGDLSRTGVRAVGAELGSRGVADGAADTLSLTARAGDDSLTAGAGDAARITLAGLPWAVTASHVDSVDRIAVNGAGGADTLHVAGSVGPDTIGVSAAGALARAVVNGTAIEADDFESLRVDPLAGQDAVTVDDLAGTDVGQVAADLGVTAGGLPDGQTDSLTVNGGAGADTIAVTGGPAGVIVSGLAAGHSMLAPDPVDRLTVNGLGGADAISAAGLAPGTAGFTLRGGPDNDTLTGSPGDDTFAWDVGDGVDVVEGGAGNDAASVAGSDGTDNLTVTPNGSRVSVVGPGGVVLDMDDVEAANFVPRGGADFVDVPAMTGTDLTAVGADLGADGQLDDVRIQGTPAVDSIKVTPSGSGVSVGGLALKTIVTTAEPEIDNLTLFALLEADIIDASGVPAGVIGITHAGGPGNDTFLGSQGEDLFIGGDGDDFALMGGGDDTFTWNPGDDSDTLEGQDGTDRLLFNGANITENFDIAPNGGRLRFFRDIANVTIDSDKVERVDLNAFGGADNIVVHDLTPTADVTQVNVNLANLNGTGDGVADNVFLHGTGGNDNITLGGGPTPVAVSGLFTTLSISNGESGDGITVLSGAGDDTINAAAVAAGSPFLTLQGDDNNDTITGSLHVDSLLGGNGDDTIFFTPGDNVDGGTGTNTILPQ